MWKFSGRETVWGKVVKGLAYSARVGLEVRAGVSTGLDEEEGRTVGPGPCVF